MGFYLLDDPGFCVRTSPLTPNSIKYAEMQSGHYKNKDVLSRKNTHVDKWFFISNFKAIFRRNLFPQDKGLIFTGGHTKF